MLSDSIRSDTSTSHNDERLHASIIVYMIPGNPGLIEYDREFLACLSDNLSSVSSEVGYEICGSSLAGFELNETAPKPATSFGTYPYSLQEQVFYIHAQLQAAVDRTDEGPNDPASSSKRRVILMGHSIGAYIMLEIIARIQAAQRDGAITATDSKYEIIGGIGLFPTVVHIAKSPSGREVTPLVRIPYLPSVVHIFAKILCSIIATNALEYLVRKIAGMPSNPARATTAFLQSKGGVRQCLHLGRFEMEQVTHDKWDDSLWGSSSPSDPKISRPKLYFFWGTNDHWVDDASRDKLIAARARRVEDGKDSTKPYMEIDSTGLPHAFSIRHNLPVAEKVAGYIEEIVREDQLKHTA